MAVKFYLLTDYKGYFGSKYSSMPYRSGFDKDLLRGYFGEFDIELVFFKAADPRFQLKNLRNNILLYTSQEDNALTYKSFIDDFVFAAECSGAIPIPAYKFLHSHENKVFQEILNKYSSSYDHIPESRVFGTLEEFRQFSGHVGYPCVLKSFSGSGSKKVFLVNSKTDAIRKIKRLVKKGKLYYRLKEQIRKIIHRGYITESGIKGKFLVQDFVDGLTHDWKVLVYGDKYFILKRDIRAGDFRASGQGLLSFPSEVPDNLLDFTCQVFKKYNVPFASFDIAAKMDKFYLLESQFVYFGTYTAEYSPCCYLFKNNKWEKGKNTFRVEKLYAESIVTYIRNNYPNVFSGGTSL